MLKKNLHFFSRYAIMLSLFTCVSLLFSCAAREENYLSFLDGSISIICEMEHNGNKIADAKIEKTEKNITVTFSSPSSLRGTALSITPEGASMSYNGTNLSSEAIPPLWLEIGELLSKDKKIIAITYDNGITEIHTESESKFYDYKTDKNGRLLCIDNGKLKINVKDEG